jgi:signal transduction histidine kinase
VIWSLLTNAVKFTPKGGLVQIHLQRVNSHVEIVVSDTGEASRPTSSRSSSSASGRRTARARDRMQASVSAWPW